MIDKFDRDEAYEDRVRGIIIRALLVGLKGDNGIVVLRSAELVNVLLETIAIVSSTSAQCDTPRSVRVFTEHCAKSLAKKIANFKAIGGESIFSTVIRDDEAVQ